jgi:hypothetical protein
MSTLFVYVENADAELLGDVRAVLQSGRKTLTGQQTEPGVVEFRDVDAGAYELRVSAWEYQEESRTVELTGGQNSVTVVLGMPDQLSFYAGDTKVYFQPDERQFLAAVRGKHATQALAEVLKRRNFSMTHLPTGRGDAEAMTGTPDDSLIAIDIPEGQTDDAGGQLLDAAFELEERGHQVKFAVPIRRGQASVQGLTNEIVVRFSEEVTRETVQEIARELGLTVERAILYAGNAFLLSRPGAPSYDILNIMAVLREKYPVKYVEPNLLVQLTLDAYTPADTLYAQQTYLPLIQADEAWDTLDDIDVNLRGGSPDITVAVFDSNGVAPNHPDLTANLTDGTSKLVISYNFSAMAVQTVAALSGDHGTQCAGSAVGAFDNASRGITGIAPNCHLIGAQLPGAVTGIEMADAFIWAAGLPTGNTNPAFPAAPARAADVISNSWGINGHIMTAAMRDCFDALTVYGRGGRGCIVTFSLGNNGHVPFTSGWARRDFAAYERTIAVGASINVNPTNPIANSSHADPAGNTMNIAVAVDTRTLYSPYGTPLDIVAPSHTAYGPALIDPIMSAVRVGTGNVDGCPGRPTCDDYRVSFGGTSHASPTVAGAAALVISVRPSLSWIEVRDILRTTAFEIDFGNTDAIGQWVDNDGDGVNEFSQWYGYGRLDVNAAVIEARDRATFADIIVRENLTDTGAVPSTGWWAHSPDIWVTTNNDPIPALAYGANPPHENPERGQDNYVFCRIKNGGTRASNRVYVRAMITHFPGFEFRYPQEFMPTNRPGDPVPNPLTPGTYLIDEVTVDNLAAGADQIVKMTWPEAMIPPETVMVGMVMARWHPCLLLEASPHDGPLPSAAGSGIDIQRDNNIAQRNLTIVDNVADSDVAFHAIMIGTTHLSGIRQLVIDRSLMDDEAQVYVRPMAIHPPDRRWEQLKQYVRTYTEGSNGKNGRDCGVRVLTRTRFAIETCNGSTLVVTAPAGAKLEWQEKVDHAALSIAEYQGVEAVEIGASAEAVELPVLLGAGQFTPLLVAVKGKGSELRLTQQRGDGACSAGYTLSFQ